MLTRVPAWLSAPLLVACAAGSSSDAREDGATGDAASQAPAAGVAGTGVATTAGTSSAGASAVSGTAGMASNVAGAAAGMESISNPMTGEAGADMPDAPDASVPDATLAQPIERAPDRLVLEVQEHVLAVDPTRGARITSFALGGSELLRPVAMDNGFLNGGATLWTSPQSDWAWPPLAAHDTEPYAIELQPDGFVARGGAAGVAGAEVAIDKRFGVELAKRAFLIDYTLRNEGTAQATLAAWEVTRVAANGVSFFAAGASAPRGDFTPALAEDHYWLDYAAAFQGTAGKLFADAGAGYLAHVAQGLLHLKTWQDVPAQSQAPNEGEIEIYLAPSYIELEVQGPYAPLSAGGSSTFSVRWQLVAVPAGLDVSPGSRALIDWVRSLLP